MKKTLKSSYSARNSKLKKNNPESKDRFENICMNASCKLRKAGCRGFEGCPGYKGK